MPPPAMRRVVAALEARDDLDLRIEAVRSVGGGDINEAAAVTTSAGKKLFLKWNDSAPDGLFEAEADGLSALGATIGRAATGDHIMVPAVVALGRVEGTAWLLMDFIGADSSGRGSHAESTWDESLGRGLAAIHRAPPGLGRGFGWHRDNFIGRLPQVNRITDDWTEFWRDRRIAPQVRRAAGSGLLDSPAVDILDRLIDRMPAALEGAAHEGPSLLHGDLWGGNAMAAGDGRAAIYDPAIHVGHREVDLAMSELFGFPGRFLPAYRESFPVDELYDIRRRDLYQLYYLLVHVNLFGRSYVGSSVAAARRVLATL